MDEVKQLQEVPADKDIIRFDKIGIERCDVVIQVRVRQTISRLIVAVLCLFLGFMLGRKSKHGNRDYLREFRIGKAEYTESLIYESYGGLQNDGITFAVYYDVDETEIAHQLDSWEKISDFPVVSSALKNVVLYSDLNFQVPEIENGKFFLYDNKKSEELHSEVEIETVLLRSEDVDFSLVVWDSENNTIYIVKYRI